MQEKKDTRLIELEREIATIMPLETFLGIQKRLAQLRSEEEKKLAFLGDLQKSYNAASSDRERDQVKQAVGKIRELSKIARKEIRGLHLEMQKFMPLERSREYYKKYLELTT
jgi:hypothetical protein